MSAEPTTAESTSRAKGPVEITDAALEQVLEIKSQENDPDSLRLRIEVTGARGVDYVYDLAFESVEDAQGDDFEYRIQDLPVVVPIDSVPKLEGSVLDLPGNEMQSGLVLRNPNRPDAMAAQDLELTGDVADKVSELLDKSVNPALAAHGGFVSLVGVDDTTVSLSMGGGCQGCSLSQATMVEGVTRSIKEAIPEVTEVVDVTAHTAGENPFYG